MHQLLSGLLRLLQKPASNLPARYNATLCQHCNQSVRSPGHFIDRVTDGVVTIDCRRAKENERGE